MKTLLLLLLLPTLLLSQTENPTFSKIESVIVYTEGALIERSASINLIKGENIINLNNLSPDIDENTIQIAGLKDVSIVSLNYSINYLEKKKLSEAFEKINFEITTLSAKRNSIENIIAGNNQELALLNQNQKINSNATDLTVEKVKEMATYYRTRITEIKNALYLQQLELLEISKQISDQQNELKKIDDSKKERRGEIKLKLNSKKALNLVLNIKYSIKNAGWFPLYDIKATDTSSPISFSYKANVYQQSGTDWENVSLTLSTGDPNTNNIKPMITPRYLNFNQPSYNKTASTESAFKYNPTITMVSGMVTDDSGYPLPGVNVLISGTNRGTQTDFDGNYSLDISGGRELFYSYVGFETESIPVYSSVINKTLKPGAQLSEVVVTGYSDKNSIDKLLQGKAAGVEITNNTGNTGSFVRIRGTGSLSSGASSPLFVVDGDVMSESDVNSIDESLIADVKFSKDRETTSRYGSRGRNGVVIITTKNPATSTKESGLTNTEFKIKEKYTINSNADITIIEVDNFKLPAIYQHYVEPELNENVFLTATLTNWEQFDFLPGEANIYFDGSYAGKSVINPQATSDSLSLSLGVDPNVIVKRKKLDNFKSTSFLGSNKIVDKGYTIEVKNNKQTAVTLIIEDRIPISENKEIKVEDIETGQAQYTEKTGILKWKINVAPNAIAKKQFTYVVKYPKYKKLYL